MSIAAMSTPPPVSRQLAGVAHRPISRLYRWVLLALALVVGTMAPAQAQTAGISGLWTTSSGDHVVFLQDSNSGATFALQVPASLDALRVWTGSGSMSAISLTGLTRPGDTLSAGISGNQMNGTLSTGGAQQPFDAQLALAWSATPYAGVWQKASPQNAYLVFCVFNTGDGRIAVQIDVTLNADSSTSFDIFTGALAGDLFTGVSIAGSGLTSRLDFNSAQLAGSYTTLGRPPQTTNFSATQIVKIGS